ncbi:hypothetical protein, partial [Acinetobacter baumannii]|uniref:hypothetical protein n=1 Tax=Acinetobacter baumannii TaxID=470 RepID=UPI001C0900EC
SVSLVLTPNRQSLPNYAGEMYFFSLADSAALSVATLKNKPDWSAEQRRKFAVRALAALAEFSEGTDGPLIHRAL